ESFETESDSFYALNYSDPAPDIPRDGLVHVIRLESSRIIGLVFDITLDTSKFPEFGTYVDMNSPIDQGWSWVIDPYNYERSSAEITVTDLTLNSGKEYPCIATIRNNEVSERHSFLLDAVLKIQVEGATPGLVYGIQYFKNGTDLLDGPQDGWMIEASEETDYATTSNYINVINYSDPAPDIPRDNGIHQVVLDSVLFPELRFYITLDTSKLPAFGSFIKMSEQGDAGWSWIIDKSCYQYIKPNSKGNQSSIYYTVSSEKQLHCYWTEAEHGYRLRFGYNGFNELPNIIGIDKENLDGTWERINSAGTDWLPPLVFEAETGTPHASMVYTGGNHGSNGDASGAQTATNDIYQILVNGKSITSEASMGYTDKIEILIVNRLMAYNTIEDARYALSQTMRVSISPGAMEVVTDVKALEPLTMKTDNGLQMVTIGAQSTMLMLDSDIAGRVPFDSSKNSGASSEYPAWAVLLKGDLVQQSSWMDREYEAGDGRYVSPSEPFIRGGGATNTKFYHAVVYYYPHVMQAGEHYKWRGGYSWQHPDCALEGYDSMWRYLHDQKSVLTMVENGQNYTLLK
ncbi:hypothetical protein, partial [Shewanella surugensis]